ncbi:MULTISPECIES: hypothetical protein [unclassified Colwellia]|uniref:hypothetical protein n=1 Tax=unclassified Colwellia TaxID=196834 RepID=UPI0015F4EAB1|nr:MULTISPECIES: hypothetical protein [unclassified Colwellia]MBA6251361.1 hypothetical protein [Colwellia sp. MB3u-55]MBA6399595.1 hypothetical protein [Colwellia sp. BRX10-4]
MGKSALESVIAYQPSSQCTVTAATILVNINDRKKGAVASDTIRNVNANSKLR